MNEIAGIGDASWTTDPLTFQWRIPGFFSLSGNVNTEYTSPIFMFRNSIWCLGLFPYGHNQSQYLPGWVGIYLRRKYCYRFPRKAYFTFGIQTSGGVEKRHDTKRKYPSGREVMKKGIRCFWLRSELWDRKSTLVPNNTLTIVCNLSSSRTDNDVKAGVGKVLMSLMSMMRSGEDCDVVIKIQETEFPAHRAILRASSPVFRDMFSRDVLEKQNNVVTIEDSDPETFAVLFDYIYSGSCKVISGKNVYSLYTAADRYGLGDLKAECAKYMKRNIIVDSFCDVITLAVKHDDKDLLEYAKYFFCHYSAVIAKKVEWQTFLEENSTVADELLSYTVQHQEANLIGVACAPPCPYDVPPLD